MIAGTVLLSLLGVAGNYFSLPLFFGIDLVFGSLATFMAIRLYGGVAGVLVAIPGALYTIVLWGHPYTAPVLILEAVTVALLATRLRYIALADGLFWLVLGGPVLMILFWLFLGQPGYVSQLVVFKHFVNGILNASLASMIVIGIDVLVRRRQVSFSQLLFNMLVLAILVPGVVLVCIDTRLSRVDLERSVAEKLNAAASFALSTLAGADDSADAARLQVTLERLPLETGIGVQYLDRDGRAAAGTSSAALPVGGSVMTISPGLEIWLPDREGASILAWWKRARYVVAREFGVPEPGGRVLAHYDASLVIQRLESRNLKAFKILAILTALTILVALGGTGVLSRPLLRLGLASVRMAEDVESKKAIQLPRGAIRETNQLAGQLSEMGNALVRSYTAIEDEKAAIESLLKEKAKELTAGANYLASLLPGPLAGSPSADWKFIPSADLGGDAFGYAWIDEDHFMMYLLDVCGHGLAPALMSISAMNVLRNQTLPGADFLSPASVLSCMNDAFQMDRYNDQYFTLWYAVYDRRSRELRYANGGHPPAILMTGASAGTAKSVALSTPGFIIGGIPGVEYEEQTVVLDAHARLYFFSDGLYEITRADGSMMSFDEFMHIVASGPRTESALSFIIDTVRSENDHKPFDDDLAIVEIRF